MVLQSVDGLSETKNRKKELILVFLLLYLGHLVSPSLFFRLRFDTTGCPGFQNLKIMLKFITGFPGLQTTKIEPLSSTVPQIYCISFVCVYIYDDMYKQS